MTLHKFLFLSAFLSCGILFFEPNPLHAACKEQDPRNAAKKKHGVLIYCSANGGWEETTYENGVQNGPKKKYYGNGKIEEEANYKEGKLHGTRKKYDPRTGRLVAVETFKEGERDGIFEEYGENGKIQKLKNYVNGKTHGEQKKFFENGDLEEVRNESAGAEDGWTLKYHNNSAGHYLYSAEFNVMKKRKYYAIFFVKGHQKNGTCYDENGKALVGTESCAEEVRALSSLAAKTGSNDRFQSLKSSSHDDEEYYSNGKPRRKCSVKDGKRHGKCETFFDTGVISSKSNYQNGLISGESIDYFENGNPKRKSNHGSSGELTQSIEFYKEGTKKKESTFEGVREVTATEYYMNESPSLEFKWTGKQQHLTKYYDNAKPSFKGRLVPKTKCYYSCWESLEYDGTVETFFEEGGLSQKTEYKDGKRQGKSITYWQNGKPQTESEYVNDRMQSEKTYSEAGVIETDVEYYPDGSKKNQVKAK